MAAKSIAIGLLLILLGGGVYGGLAFKTSDLPSVTALIPAFFGIAILVAGIVALRDALRMHAMHGVALFSLLGVVAPVGRLGMALVQGKTPSGIATASLLLMAVLCGVLLTMCVQSFVAARRRQRAEQAQDGK